MTTKKAGSGATRGTRARQAARAGHGPATAERAPSARLASLEELTPDPRNANKGTERGVGMLEQSLRKYGAGRSILVDKHGVIIAGNKTHERAVDLGLEGAIIVETDGTRLVVVKRTDLEAGDPAAAELGIADNRVAEVGLEWDPAVLEELVASGASLDGFWSQRELNAMLSPGGTKGLTDPNEVPAGRATDIIVGDFFELGRHRLACGDCTDESVVERLMGGERAGLMNTDPPYGIEFDNAALGPTRKNYAAIKGDKHSDGDAFQRFLESAFGIAKHTALGESAAWYLWHAQLTQGYFAAAAAAAAAAANLVLHRQIIWVKPRLILGRGQYHWKHELCFMGWIDGHQCPDYGLGNGERTQTTVWEIDGVDKADRDDFAHASPKPVELFNIPIVKHLRAGEACYDPFAGSGPQFIAAEQHHVRCYATELEPRHCQVIIDRWEAFTGQKAVKVGEAIRA